MAQSGLNDQIKVLYALWRFALSPTSSGVPTLHDGSIWPHHRHHHHSRACRRFSNHATSVCLKLLIRVTRWRKQRVEQNRMTTFGGEDKCAEEEGGKKRLQRGMDERRKLVGTWWLTWFVVSTSCGGGGGARLRDPTSFITRSIHGCFLIIVDISLLW